MHTRADRHRRPLHRLTLGACCLVLATSGSAFGQLLEFKSSEVRGRLDRPSMQNIWLLGDDNGNGAIDDNETMGPRIDVDNATLDDGRHNRAISNDPIDASQEFDSVRGGLPGPYAPDGLAVDERENSSYRPEEIDTESRGRVPDAFSSNEGSGDFDDLVRLPTSFQSIGVDNFANYGSAHLMHVFTFVGEPEFTLSALHETVELGIGARFVSGFSDFRFYGSGGVLGESKLDSSIESRSLGPQASLWWTIRKDRFKVQVGGAAALTYMNLDGDQRGQFGADLVPGQYNRPIFFQSQFFDDHFEQREIAPVLEAGVRGSYDVTSTTQCFIRADALQFSEIRNAMDATIFELPRMGLRDPGGFDVTVTAASIGVEVRR